MVKDITGSKYVFKLETSPFKSLVSQKISEGLQEIIYQKCIF